MPHEVPALIVRQWLDDWRLVRCDAAAHRSEPPRCFYLLSLPAVELRALSGIYRRSTHDGISRASDLGIQRRHEPERSEEIAEFVRYGFPWSSLSPARRDSGEFDDLRKPGWLPTAIVVNILKPIDVRRRHAVDAADLISVTDDERGGATIALPTAPGQGDWCPSGLPPIEVIDGQHRLWAFESAETLTGQYEVPVVAFHGLDISWQAYLFWTINIKPKRINASLAFDLYPLLRAEDWLEKFEGHSVYRETRAQELTEALWSHPRSPWHRRINMLGEPGMPWVRQAAWVRSLMASYVKSSSGRRIVIGGLFGAPTGSDQEMLPWSRAQQAAFLIHVFARLRDAIGATDAPWARALRGRGGTSTGGEDDPAYYGECSLINTDQGIRGILQVSNDLCFCGADVLELGAWSMSEAAATDQDAVTAAVEDLHGRPVGSFVADLAGALATFDWRTSAAPGWRNAEERNARAALRGSGGYRLLRMWLLEHLSKHGGGIGAVATQVAEALGYEPD